MPNKAHLLDHATTASPPPHLESWRLPPGWSWGEEAIQREQRHYQEVVDALGRSLSLVTAPDPAHAVWLKNEARALAHRNHPSIPTTYHFWGADDDRRGPGYLRRWISGETVFSRVARLGPEAVPFAFQVLREAGSTLAYLHDTSISHGAVAPSTVWLTPGGRLWLLGWEWVLPPDQRPMGALPDSRQMPWAPEWASGVWQPSPLSDQWQLAAMMYMMLTGERAPSGSVPALEDKRPDCPHALSTVLGRALLIDPLQRYPSIAAMLKELDRHVSVRPVQIAPDDETLPSELDTDEARLRWVTADDYEILAPLGTGMFGSVWRARDLSLSREVAIKVLHPHIAVDDVAVARFRREARLAAQLAHAAIIPIYETDSRGGVVWYTMELAEGGSVADLISRRGARPVEEIALQVDEVLEALHAAHASGIIHRDLKPENILIDRYRRWRIGDFGIAYALGDGNTGTSGTPAFAAPEQLLGEAQGPATDCYALASIVFFVLTGKPPFGEGKPEVILARQLSGDLQRRLHDLGFSEGLTAWLSRGLAECVEDRFEDAQEMRIAWRHVLRSMRHPAEHKPWWRRLLEGLGDDETSEVSKGW